MKVSLTWAELVCPTSTGSGIATGQATTAVELIAATGSGTAVLRFGVPKLRSDGFGIREASSGECALASIQEEVPALVLMDIRMPGIDGLEATRRLRRLEGCARVPVIALSADASDETRTAALAAGANAFLSKPVDHDELAALIAGMLGLEQWQTASAATAPAGEEMILPPPADQLKVLLEFAHAGNMRAIRQFADEIAAIDPKYRPFAGKLQKLARRYQSPAILRLIEQHSKPSAAA